MENLTRYSMKFGKYSGLPYIEEVPCENGEWVKFSDIVELRSSTDVQQLKPKMPTLAEIVPNFDKYSFKFQSTVVAIYKEMCRHFGH